MFFVEIEDGKIVSKYNYSNAIKLPINHREISKSIYDSIGSMPCAFTEVDGEIVNIEYVEPVQVIIPLQPTQDDYMLDLDYRLSKIELGI